MRRLIYWTAIAALLSAAPLSAADGPLVPDPIFDVPALTSTPLHARTLERSEHDGIVTEQVRFHSETDGDKQVEIFAFLSYPQGARAFPAYIWNPGGLGQASPAYTELGARRGYVVLCIDFPQPGYRSTGDYPINSGLFVGDDPRQAPIYHGAVALLKAVSFLISRPEVDPERIGMAGSSWGGFFTTLMAGIDSRLKVAACLYGTGGLHLGNAWWDGPSSNGREPPTPAERERWRQTLDPAWRLPTKRTPIAWFTGTNDVFYLMPAVMHSYERAAGPRHLMLLPNWDHALPATLHDELIFSWLDAYLQDATPPPAVSPVTVSHEESRITACWDFDGDAVSADLIVSYGATGNWRGRYWQSIPATIDGHSCRAEIPAARYPCFISGAVVDKRGHRSSTPLLLVDPASFGVVTEVRVPDYDGCSEWGGFEETQIAFLARHTQSGQTRWVPDVSADAYAGRASAVVQPGTTLLPPILSTALAPHQFRCRLKADAPTEIVLQIADKQARAKIGTEWTEVVIEHTPPATIIGDIPATITTPPDSVVLIDAVSFHPLH
ncbi:MAG: acetylxylan esterase [Planctomycetaceae bacterium]|nr:acetylxylan esterase [Planctomycetaceae bacterium]